MLRPGASPPRYRTAAMITLFLVLLALVLFLLAGVSVPSGRYGLGWLGAASLTLAWLIERMGAV
jgi:hypothetical protein